MSYSWNTSEFGYVAAAFRSAANAIPTPTPSPSPTPTVTPTVPPAPSGQIWRSYYFAGAQRIAMRVHGDPVPANNGVFYLLGDHLGSTSIVVDSSGNLVSELRYKAWGETRYSSGAPATDYRYTGQREEAGIGLYYYRARWYDPALVRFVQPDTIIPGPAYPPAFDRYSYVQNNPLRFTDPSGHILLCDETCDNGNWSPSLAQFGIVVTPNWTSDDRAVMLKEATAIAGMLSLHCDCSGVPLHVLFSTVFGGTTFTLLENEGKIGCKAGAGFSCDEGTGGSLSEYLQTGWSRTNWPMSLTQE